MGPGGGLNRCRNVDSLGSVSRETIREMGWSNGAQNSQQSNLISKLGPTKGAGFRPRKVKLLRDLGPRPTNRASSFVKDTFSSDPIACSDNAQGEGLEGFLPSEEGIKRGKQGGRNTSKKVFLQEQ